MYRAAAMVKTTAHKKPTDSEMKILRVLWEHGELSVRAVHEVLSVSEGMGYTTVLKLMQIMTEKEILKRDTSVRPQLFKAKQAKQKTQRHMLRDMMDRAFGGSPGALALQALATRKSTPEELREVRRLLDKLEEQE